jgi:hypothetical protein
MNDVRGASARAKIPRTLTMLFLLILSVAYAQPCSFRCGIGVKRPTKDAMAIHHGCPVLASTVREPVLVDLFDAFPVTFQHCCNQLDDCYARCGEEKGICDMKLLKCVEAVCRTTNLESVMDGCLPVYKLLDNKISMKNLLKGTQIFTCDLYQKQVRCCSV